jgi:hypothetical protein
LGFPIPVVVRRKFPTSSLITTEPVAKSASRPDSKLIFLPAIVYDFVTTTRSSADLSLSQTIIKKKVKNRRYISLVSPKKTNSRAKAIFFGRARGDINQQYYRQTLLKSKITFSFAKTTGKYSI